ncbi:MAG: tetratricopeptide repeat protein [Cyanobacteria bacterium HKST-UBA06]|nr:tetratricopeptide repeat protein [Cyanobacteria bacterium HKST-UBA06]
MPKQAKPEVIEAMLLNHNRPLLSFLKVTNLKPLSLLVPAGLSLCMLLNSLSPIAGAVSGPSDPYEPQGAPLGENLSNRGPNGNSNPSSFPEKATTRQEFPHLKKLLARQQTAQPVFASTSLAWMMPRSTSQSLAQSAPQSPIQSVSSKTIGKYGARYRATAVPTPAPASVSAAASTSSLQIAAGVPDTEQPKLRSTQPTQATQPAIPGKAAGQAFKHSLFSQKSAQTELPPNDDPDADAATSPDLDQAGAAYRDGAYQDAFKRFARIVKTQPECVDCHYYYAISAAQMGRIETARQAYNRVLTLAPNSEAAELAKTGLGYLPEGNQLDVPPKLSGSAQQTTTAGTSKTTAAQPASGMDSQTLQTMMMMSALGGGSKNGGGMNMMMLPLLQQMQQGGNTQEPGQTAGMPKVDPSVMQTMMMQQMMGGYEDFFSNKDND